MLSLISYIALTLTFNSSLAKTISVQSQSKKWIEQKACATTVDQRIQAHTDQIEESGLSASRIAFFDVALPGSPEEYQSLDCQGVLMVTALTQDESEFPIQAKIGGTKLRLLTCAKEPAPNKKISAALGAHRMSCFFALPIERIFESGKITLDWEKNRKDQLIAKLPFTADGITRCKPKNPNLEPDFKTIVQREYCIKLP